MLCVITAVNKKNAVLITLAMIQVLSIEAYLIEIKMHFFKRYILLSVFRETLCREDRSQKENK